MKGVLNGESSGRSDHPFSFFLLAHVWRRPHPCTRRSKILQHTEYTRAGGGVEKGSAGYALTFLFLGLSWFDAWSHYNQGRWGKGRRRGGRGRGTFEYYQQIIKRSLMAGRMLFSFSSRGYSRGCWMLRAPYRVLPVVERFMSMSRRGGEVSNARGWWFFFLLISFFIFLISPFPGLFISSS